MLIAKQLRDDSIKASFISKSDFLNTTLTKLGDSFDIDSKIYKSFKNEREFCDCYADYIEDPKYSVFILSYSKHITALRGKYTCREIISSFQQYINDINKKYSVS